MPRCSATSRAQGTVDSSASWGWRICQRGPARVRGKPRACVSALAREPVRGWAAARMGKGGALNGQHAPLQGCREPAQPVRSRSFRRRLPLLLSVLFTRARGAQSGVVASPCWFESKEPSGMPSGIGVSSRLYRSMVHQSPSSFLRVIPSALACSLHCAGRRTHILVRLSQTTSTGLPSSSRS